MGLSTHELAKTKTALSLKCFSRTLIIISIILTITEVKIDICSGVNPFSLLSVLHLFCSKLFISSNAEKMLDPLKLERTLNKF